MDQPSVEPQSSPSAFHLSGKVVPGEEFVAEVTFIGPAGYVAAIFLYFTALVAATACLIYLAIHLATH